MRVINARDKEDEVKEIEEERPHKTVCSLAVATSLLCVLFENH